MSAITIETDGKRPVTITESEYHDFHFRIASLENRLAEALERNVKLEDERKWQPIENSSWEKEYIFTKDFRKVFTCGRKAATVLGMTHFMPIPKLPEEK
ncbi:MAG: hypothetical protein UW18_C0018G0014 [Microgenomates group bacterium GW2011_GWF1_44_10]|nr:MAG: hypothetical protein UW18_C0018G0014 [Microgenomates group bacterium GW2011_GWF1_44_10]